MSLVVDQLSLHYGQLRALEKISVQAKAGRITALIGPNAAGKSTLLKCIVGGLRPTAGCVLIDDRPAHRLSAATLARRIAYVPQRSVVSAAFTVREVVELGRYALPQSRARVDDALGRLDLIDVADRPFPSLSVGQQQRVTLARAVAQLSEDGHLLTDEPTSAMDLKHVRQSLQLLRRLADGGATVLIAIHDLARAVMISDETWLLAGARLVAAGETRKVMDLKRLESVFGVRFEWIERPGKTPILHAC
ncbi:MAG: ABC transporter ATP-binding protein [Planctomycetes bacterium]|nr:ABC transporter ATP-binding protein [Planctomycetota bacterium]